MSAQPVTARRTRPATKSRRRSRAAVLRRRLALGAGLALVVVAVLSLVEPADRVVREIKLPLRHEDIIRQQAADKNVDPTLIAAVIYVESRFRDQTSHAGAKGLMQLMPETADYIARKSGGTRFTRADLATPQINIAYGTWYLRYLFDKYDGNTVLTLAAYNAGEGKVDQWWREASEKGEKFRVSDHIPFPETREYVGRVLSARADYRANYKRELAVE
ncbi:MAG TPA: lytic transglycosylase domain-containing protein [Solirubrobacter sp.]|nr:lytic transglycosylase domain-containing protein [Solirubrobacter sp.]